MTTLNDAVAAVAAAFDESAFPPGFLETFDQLECLSARQGAETFLVREKESGALFVAKCYDRTQFPEVHEDAILRSLSHEALPRWRATFESERATCVVREYVEGVPLSEYAAERRLRPGEAADVCARLCDVLSYLHGQKPSVIHRDIKPQNVIVRPDGRVALIDFGIARVYRDGMSADTQVFGTCDYAPPEQYGFSQTDCRADLYSLGVLLCWLLTGGISVKRAPIANRRLRAVVRRCTELAPERRFSSARAVKKALLRAGERHVNALYRRVVAVCALCVGLAAGFVLGRFTGVLRPAAAGVTFREPLIGQAVRLQLGKAADETIVPEELRAVRTLYIFGETAYATREEFDESMRGAPGGGARGTVISLEDVLLLPGLTELHVCFQDLSDLSPLARATELECVDTRHTRVRDVSPLAGLRALSSVSLYETDVEDILVLETCPRLRYVDVGKTLVRSPAELGCADTLTSLSLKNLYLDTLEGIGAFARVSVLEMQQACVDDLSPILQMPALETLYLDENQREQAETQLAGANFAVCYG